MDAQLAFKKIWGVGAKTAQALFERDGIASIGELRVRFSAFFGGRCLFWGRCMCCTAGTPVLSLLFLFWCWYNNVGINPM